MRHLSLVRVAFLAVFGLAGFGLAQAQTSSPQQLQGMIANGQQGAALAQLNTVLQAHPDSGVAWYLTAEAQDASGNVAAARSALAKAEQFSPGLPFAKPAEVSALQAHLAGPVAQHSGGMGSVIIVIGAFVVLFLLIRMFLRGRQRMAYRQPGFDGMRNPYQNGPMGGGMPYQQQGGMGGGIGSSIIGGLAAGAGFAAGERVVDDLMGNRGGDQAFGGTPTPDRDDGLNGSQGWDDNSGGGDNFDPNNGW